MKVLFYLEPAVYRGDPLFLSPHISWALRVLKSLNVESDFGLVSSSELCDYFYRMSGIKNNLFKINSWEIISPFNYQRNQYSSALYSVPESLQYKNLYILERILKEVRNMYQPDIVICSSQNTVIESVFFDIATIYIERAPLPRLNQKASMVFDPSGHQVNSLLSTLTSQIFDAKLPDTEKNIIGTWWDAFSNFSDNKREHQKQVAQQLEYLSRGRKIVAFALQPPDWITFEGAYKQISVEALIASWARSLPVGWVGIPFFHPGSRFPENLVASLEDEFENIAFLPKNLSKGSLELALENIDGLITISSTTAMSAMLSGINTIVVGKSPFSNIISSSSPQHIAEVGPLSVRNRASLIAFLCNRYCRRLTEVFNPNGGIEEIVQAISSSESFENYYLDYSSWSLGSIRQVV